MTARANPATGLGKGCLPLTQPCRATLSPLDGERRILRNAHIVLEACEVDGESISVAVPSVPNHCWITSLATLLGPVAREEIRREMTGIQAIAAIALSHGIEAFARLTAVDKAVFPGAGPFSTRLYEDGEAESLLAARDNLATAFPDRAVVLRSLTRRDHGDVLTRDAVLWPVRVIWTIDDSGRDWLPRRDVRRDLRLLDAGGFATVLHRRALPGEKRDRILALYRRLYIDHYSRHNPDYTADGIDALVASGQIDILTLERDGDIAAFCALHSCAGVMSIPMLGYAAEAGEPDGLYRAIMAAAGREAVARNERRNLSAGAARFKRNRGARPHVEYLLILDHHLPAWRRFGYRAIAALLRTLEPLLMKVATA